MFVHANLNWSLLQIHIQVLYFHMCVQICIIWNKTFRSLCYYFDIFGNITFHNLWLDKKNVDMDVECVGMV